MSSPLCAPETAIDWALATAIRDHTHNLVILPRQPPVWIGAALDVLPDTALPGFELDGEVESVGEHVALQLSRLLPDDIGAWLTTDIRMLLGGWTRITEEVRCRLRMEAVGTDACRKFHTDQVRIRLLCTYRGPGSEWVPDEHVQRSRLGPHGENEDIVPELSAVRRVPRFAAALLKGDAFDRRTPGIVHRSPLLASGVPHRLVLRIDGHR
jgi:hypothetical protein